MEECKLVDCVELPLKSYDDSILHFTSFIDSGLRLYLHQFVVPIVEDWPCRFYVWIHNLIPFIGPLHISLKAKENILLKFPKLYADLYAFLISAKYILQKAKALAYIFHP